MSSNKAYAKKIGQWLKKAPHYAHHAILSSLIWDVTENTYQDSGNASFNWKAVQGSNTSGSIRFNYGIPPVGRSGDGRTDQGKEAITAAANYRRTSDLLYKVRTGRVKETTVFNPVATNLDYSKNAELKLAYSFARGRVDANMVAGLKRWMMEAP